MWLCLLVLQAVWLQVGPVSATSTVMKRTATRNTRKLNTSEAAKYERVFQYFKTKEPIHTTLRGTGHNVTYDIDGIDTDLLAAYEMLVSVVGDAPAHPHGLIYTMGPEKSQGVSNARIARSRFFELALLSKTSTVRLPLIRSHAKNLDSLEEKKGVYSGFDEFYDVGFLKRTSEPLNVQIAFSTKIVKSDSDANSGSRRYSPSAKAWSLPPGDSVCHPIDPALSKPLCVGYDNYARLAPLPMHLAAQPIRKQADTLERGLRDAALRVSNSKSANFVALHMRLEKDWTKWFAQGLCFNGTEIARRTVAAARREMCGSAECPVVVYVMGNPYADLDIEWPKNTHHFSKYDFIREASVTSDTASALIDADIALRANMFVGTPRSGHSSIIYWDRHLLRKRSWQYERYTHLCDKYVDTPMPEAETCDSAETACRYGAFRTLCLNMHCLTTGLCNFSYPSSPQPQGKPAVGAKMSRQQERMEHQKERERSRRSVPFISSQDMDERRQRDGGENTGTKPGYPAGRIRSPGPKIKRIRGRSSSDRVPIRRVKHSGCERMEGSCLSQPS